MSANLESLHLSVKADKSAIADLSALYVCIGSDLQMFTPPNRGGAFTERLIRAGADTDNGETRICSISWPGFGILFSSVLHPSTNIINRVLVENPVKITRDIADMRCRDQIVQLSEGVSLR